MCHHEKPKDKDTKTRHYRCFGFYCEIGSHSKNRMKAKTKEGQRILTDGKVEPNQ